MSASKHSLAASASHLRPSDLCKLLLSVTNVQDRCLIKTLYWLSVRRGGANFPRAGCSLILGSPTIGGKWAVAYGLPMGRLPSPSSHLAHDSNMCRPHVTGGAAQESTLHWRKH